MKEEGGERKLNIVNLLIAAIVGVGVLLGAGWGAREYMDTYCTDSELHAAEVKLSDKDAELKNSIAGLSRQINQQSILMRIRELESRLADAEKTCPPDPLHNSNCPRRIKSDYEDDLRELNKLRDFMRKLEEKNLLEAQ